MDKKYKSTAQLATGFTSDESVSLSEDKTSNPFEVSTKFSNTIETMSSVPVMSLVSYRLILHDLKDPNPFRKLGDQGEIEFLLEEGEVRNMTSVFEDRLNKFKILNPSEPEDKKAIAILESYRYDYESLIDNFSIARQKTSDFINVEFLSENALLSAFVVNFFCEEFIKFNKTLKVDRSSVSIEFLEKLLEDKRRIRDEKTAALSEFKVQNNVFNYGAESENKITQISDYEIAKEVEEKKIAGLEFSISKINQKIQTYKKADKDEISRVNQRIIELRRSINELSSSSDEGTVTKVKRLRDELQLEMSRLDLINDIDSQEALSKLNDDRDKLELDLQIAVSNLSSIELALRRAKFDVSGFATKEARLADLQRDLQTALDEYESAQEKFSAAKNKASVIGTSLRQILEGQPSSDPEPSKGILLAGLAGIGTLTMCILVILAMEFASFSIRNQGRLESQTGMRNIAVLNFITLNVLAIQKIFEGENKDKELNAFVHFLRKFRFEVENSKGQVLLVASTKSNVGKSFTIVCISYTLSLLNKSILIIDTNFKNNTLTKMLIGSVGDYKLLKKGLISEAHLLQENNNQSTHQSEKNNDLPDANAKKEIIYKTQFKGIDIIGNMGGRDSPSEIFAGKNFNEMLKKLTLSYDYVILEGPSLNEYSDTKELIQYVDKVIAVFDADTVLDNLDFDSIKYLKSIKHKLIGSVLNKIKLKDLAL